MLNFTDGRRGTDSRPRVQFYDDLSMLQRATHNRGFIVSGDRYADVSARFPEFESVIRTRRLTPKAIAVEGRFATIGEDRFVDAIFHFDACKSVTLCVCEK